MPSNESNIIIYNTLDGRASVALYAHDGSVWMNQAQLAELFDTSVPNMSMHITNVLKEKELQADSVIKNYLTTASDGKQFNARRKAFAAAEADREEQLELSAATDEELAVLQSSAERRS